MNETIIVMSGNFNPPTLAHYKLMLTAMSSLKASRGIFVTTSYDYVTKKLKKLECRQDVLSTELRIEMLNSICNKDSRLLVSDIQIDKTGIINIYEVVKELQNEYPDDQIYYIVGSEELKLIPKAHQNDEYLDHINILIANREKDDLERVKLTHPVLYKRLNKYTVIDIPEDIKDISSTLFRERLHNNDQTAKELVSEEVWNILNEEGKIPWNTINNFHLEGYEFLSNFYEAKINYKELVYQSSEVAFQAQKCMNEEDKIPFTTYTSRKSKSAGKKVKLRPDWEEVKLDLMEEIVREKFKQNPELAIKLIETGDKILVEGNHWHDTYWGVDTRSGKGKNHLGKILMKIRKELK